MRSNLAHIADPTALLSSWLSSWWLVAAGCVVAILVIENHVVAGYRPVRLVRGTTVLAIATLVSALLVPVGGNDFAGAQSGGGALPDLISDPPRPATLSEIVTDGGRRLVLTFDGYVHNIGEGALDVVGNPQLPDGMKQRVQNGDDWEIVGAPTVRYETDDGHNHFHLIEAIEYVLWNELQGAQTAIGSKIGFCLVDSEQMEPGVDTSYSEELDNFCDEDDPGSTDLRMGISSGWRDIYDATTTLQWVDVSNVAPGRYWIGAVTDPNQEIAESNEDNNELIFSERTAAVPGFAPRPQPPLPVTESAVTIELRTTPHGEVTQPVYVIESGPASGTLDVPIGTPLDSPFLTYRPEADFAGTDELVFSVRDAASPYPYDPPTLTLTLEVTDAAAATASSIGDDAAVGQPPVVTAPTTFFETTAGEFFTEEFSATDGLGGPARFYAKGLPAGLVANSETGMISGVALEEGIFEVELLAVGADADGTTTQTVSWIVNAAETVGGLGTVADRSSPRGALTRTQVGTSGLGLTFEADGLPPGLSIEPTAPFVIGAPTEVGVYQVELRQIEAGDVVATTSFTWTIRTTTAIDFAL